MPAACPCLWLEAFFFIKKKIILYPLAGLQLLSRIIDFKDLTRSPHRTAGMVSSAQ